MPEGRELLALDGLPVLNSGAVHSSGKGCRNCPSQGEDCGERNKD